MLLFIFFAFYVTVLRNKLSEQYRLDGAFINIICIISFTGRFKFLLLCCVVYVYILCNLC
jgi:hypothetical protein